MPKPSSAVLVGRTNVGKSSLFNRLIGQSQAIVSPEPGTTRDVIRALVSWRGEQFWLEDTGGLDPDSRDQAASASRQHLERALQRAGVVIFMVDGTIGLTPQDRAIARRLRALPNRTIMVINKIDGPKTEVEAARMGLGFADTVLTSARTGRGLGDLLDLITSTLEPAAEPNAQISLGLFGKTNVGKSSLFNRLLGEERSIVLPTPHTTRDRIVSHLEHDGVTLQLNDTAGLRRQLQNAPRLEQQSVQQSQQALDNIDVAVLVIDGSTEPTWQDQRLGDLIVGARCAALVIINKADLVPVTEQENVARRLARWLPMVAWAPTLWVSATTGAGCDRIIPQAKAAAAAWRRQLLPSEIERFWKLLKRSHAIRQLTLVNFEQVATSPPRFILHIKRKADMPKAVGPWVEGQLRAKFDFTGTPLRVRTEGVRGTT